jgi:hypothetical protein
VLFLAGLPRVPHCTLDEGMLRVLGEEQHDFAAGTLPGIAVLQPSGAIAEYGLAARALNLDETHPRSTMIDENGSSGEPKCLKKA